MSSRAVSATQQAPRRGRAIAATATDSVPTSDAVQLSETLLEESPHVGREAEYEAVVSYVARRWSHETNTALFVCGGCGCGKTSTVKRALRAMSARVLPCDATGRSLVKRGSAEERGWASAEAMDSSDSSSVDQTLKAAGKPLQPSSGTTTPRTSHQLGSDAAGLIPFPSSSALPGRTRSSLSDASSSSSAAVNAVGSATNTPAATRYGSRTWRETVVFSSASSPASGRPSASSEDSTASAVAAAGPARCSTRKRSREETTAHEDDSAKTESHGGERRARTRRGAAQPPAAPLKAYSLKYFQTRYPEVFLQAGGSAAALRRASSSTSTSSASGRSLFGHYVNCADVSGPLLVEAVCESIRATCTRGDIASHALLQQLARLNGKSGSGGAAGQTAALSKQLQQQQQEKLKTALHVVALDEVEYVRGGGAKTLAQLAELAFQVPGQLAFIFISNQRAFVHVPQMMLEALLFEPYSEEQLRRIGADATQAELHRCELLSKFDTSATTSINGQRSRVSLAVTRNKEARKASSAAALLVRASDVDIKPRLYDYIARKALLEYSGDVRQVIAMCHRVVSVAWEEVAEAKAKAAHEQAAVEKAPAAGRRAASSPVAASRGHKTTATATVSPDLPAKLQAVVETYNAEAAAPLRGSGDHGSGDRGAGSNGSSASPSARTSAALTSAEQLTVHLPASAHSNTVIAASSPPLSSPSPTSGVMTLAKSVRLLQSNQVECDIDRYIGTLPEQTLYVLSCIVVLTLRKQEERTYAMTSVGGRIGTSRTPGAGVAAAQRTAPTLSLKLHEVHQLYTRLMAELHFPAMRADGFPLQVECLADFGVLTRPQLRGTDRIFSLNGTWTLPAMQQALVKRGEAIKQDRITAGAEAMVGNKFEELLHELSRLVRH